MDYSCSQLPHIITEAAHAVLLEDKFRFYEQETELEKLISAREDALYHAQTHTGLKKLTSYIQDNHNDCVTPLQKNLLLKASENLSKLCDASKQRYKTQLSEKKYSFR